MSHTKGKKKKKRNKLIHIKQGCANKSNPSKTEHNGRQPKADRAGGALLLQFTAFGMSLTLASKLSLKREKSPIML